MLQDLRYAVRSLTRRPLMTAVAVLSLALGIGVNTAIFSVFDLLLLRRLPVKSPGDIVVLVSPGPKPGSLSAGDSGGPEAVFSYPLFRDLEREQTVFDGIGAQRDFPANLSYRGQTIHTDGVLVSGGYFPTLALTPALGRLFTLDDDRVPAGHDVVVLAHDFWATQFGRDPAVVNSTLTVNGAPMTIVGVAPEGFHGTSTMERPRVFIPLTMAAQVRPGWTGIDRRNDHWLYVFGRLKPGLTREQAQTTLNVPFAALMRDVEFPILRSGIGSDRDREAFQERRILLEPGEHGQNAAENREEIRGIVVLLFAVTGFVLLIACANVANLLLARATDRGTEIAIHQALGASAGRLIRLLLTESCLLGVIGACGAVIVARVTVSAMLLMLPVEDRTMLAFEIDTSALVFTGILGLATGVLFGLFPAIQAARASLTLGLGAQSVRVSGSRAASRFRASLATAQIALATALLAQSGLFVVSLVNIARVDLGIRREGLVTFRLSPNLSGYTPERMQAFYDRVEDDLRAVPGVTSATSTTNPLLADSESRSNVTIEGVQHDPDADMVATRGQVSSDYFRTLGVPLVAGREFTRADVTGRQKVAIVNEAFVRKFNLGADVLGRRMARGAGTKKELDIEIVGLVRDSAHSEVRDRAKPQVFFPYRQEPPTSVTFYARTSGDVRAAPGGESVTRPPGRCQSADRELTDHGRADLDERDGRAHAGRALRIVRRSGDVARRNRAVRHAGLHGDVARARVGHSHGARRHERRSSAAHLRPPGAHHPGWQRRRHCRCARSRPARAVLAVRPRWVQRRHHRRRVRRGDWRGPALRRATCSPCSLSQPGRSSQSRLRRRACFRIFVTRSGH